ncbi:MAG: site-2 protease family protein [Chloroflexota bacterium]
MTTLEQPNPNEIVSIVEKYFTAQEVMWGDNKQNFLARFRGDLRMDSVEAFDGMSAALRSHKIQPLFRIEEGRQTVLLIKGIIEPEESNPWINVGLFFATLLSMLLIGAANVYEGPVADNMLQLYGQLMLHLGSGWPYAGSLLAILLAHEFGHYFAGRYHKTAVTLPYFIPLPLIGGFGTLGAAIRLKEPPKNKRVLLDIGIAGPLAGLVVAIPIVLFGLINSDLGVISEGSVMEGNSIIYLLAKYIAHGELLPAPISYGDVNPILFWIKYIFTGLPFPIGGKDVLLNPVAWAGWAGLLVTAINLIPTGQLDGGHTLYALIGEKVSKLRPYVLGVLLAMGFLYSGWWLWAMLIYFLGRFHAQPYDQITQLDSNRKILAVITLIIFILVFIPVPLRLLAPAAGL